MTAPRHKRQSLRSLVFLSFFGYPSRTWHHGSVPAVSAGEVRAHSLLGSPTPSSDAYKKDFKPGLALKGEASCSFVIEPWVVGSSPMPCTPPRLILHTQLVTQARLNIIDGVRVAFNVKPIEITHDDLFVLLASYNSDIGIRRVISHT